MVYHIDKDNVLSIYNENTNIMFYQNNGRFWYKLEFDNNGNRIYYKNSSGRINRYGKYVNYRNGSYYK